MCGSPRSRPVQARPRQLRTTAVFERLDVAGVFQLKGAVAELAVQLGISEPTVYRTLRAIRGDLP
ncbi:helix-turn-helix domain-containing protein [Trueperella pyogenes]|uniref:helix-turn-helix domain-containing protein n=1 Tax=Trueperella pyogenes TaxID=1661 RepID=UPI00345CEF20